MVFFEWVKHAMIGGLFASIAHRPLESYVLNSNLPDDKKDKAVGAAIGAVGGGALGYFLGEQVCNGNGYDSKKKLASTAFGVAGGLLIGYAIGGHIAAKKQPVYFAHAEDGTSVSQKA
ncbi:MAG: hypothetical protein V1866_06735 [archaeon]